jgi:hypothetical protein
MHVFDCGMKVRKYLGISMSTRDSYEVQISNSCPCVVSFRPVQAALPHPGERSLLPFDAEPGT